jgi:hypothetical protein
VLGWRISLCLSTMNGTNLPRDEHRIYGRPKSKMIDLLEVEAGGQIEKIEDLDGGRE